jgi:DUF1365 family protein
LKQAIRDYAGQKGVSGVERIELVAHMRTFGYTFNPAAFYFCYGEDDLPLCAVLEVTNTYREKKAYFIAASGADRIEGSQAKDFYVSPFVELDAHFEFDFAMPTARLKLRIDSLKNGRRVVGTLVTGNKVEWSSFALLKRLVRFPLVTFQVIARIHFRAFILYLKKVPYLRKNDRLELQKGGLS